LGLIYCAALPLGSLRSPKSDRLLDDVLQRHDPFGAAELIDHDGALMAFMPHVQQQRRRRRDAGT